MPLLSAFTDHKEQSQQRSKESSRTVGPFEELSNDRDNETSDLRISRTDDIQRYFTPKLFVRYPASYFCGSYGAFSFACVLYVFLCDDNECVFETPLRMLRYIQVGCSLQTSCGLLHLHRTMSILQGSPHTPCFFRLWPCVGLSCLLYGGVQPC